MPRNVRSLVSDVLALALGFAVAGFSTTVLSAARATTRSTSALPSVWLLSPADSQAVTGTVTLAATASQDTEALQFQLNGGNLGPTITSGACSMNWNSVAVPDGSYTLTVVGYDGNGNSTTSGPALVTVENTVAQISGVMTSGLTNTSALVTWTTNQPSSSSVDYGTANYTNSTPFELTLTTQHAVTVVGLQPGTTYHFRVSSWNGVGLLAASNDFTFTTAAGSTPGTPSNPSGPIGCTTPDPFTAIGGGVCVNGGWLPMGAAAFISQVGTPVTTGGCSTPDPFTAIGGGTCVNGGWLPHNMVTPPPAPPASSVNVNGCSTPDPFTAMGGGTCVNGGWLPPGYPVPHTAPPPTVAPPSSSTGCPGSDPFAIMGGGTCYNGGWFPPGMLPAVGNVTPVTPPPAPAQGGGGCGTSDPFVGIPGLKGVCVNGGWYPVRSGS